MDSSSSDSTYKTIKFPNGQQYVGELQHGKMHGYGVMTSPNGTKYDGDWAGGVMHGYGTLQLPDGTRYEGNWANGKKQGMGTLTWPGGVQEKGWWENDQFKGLKPQSEEPPSKNSPSKNSPPSSPQIIEKKSSETQEDDFWGESSNTSKKTEEPKESPLPVVSVPPELPKTSPALFSKKMEETLEFSSILSQASPSTSIPKSQEISSSFPLPKTVSAFVPKSQDPNSLAAALSKPIPPFSPKSEETIPFSTVLSKIVPPFTPKNQEAQGSSLSSSKTIPAFSPKSSEANASSSSSSLPKVVLPFASHNTKDLNSPATVLPRASAVFSIKENDKKPNGNEERSITMKSVSEAEVHTVDFPNGQKYVGGLKNGKMHGKGVMASPDGTKYDGEWENGLMHGYGILTWPGGVQEKGWWKKGSYQGEKKNF